MILAAAACGENPSKFPPPRELVLFWECQSFPGVLPYSGALLDQPAGLVGRMRKAHEVYSVFHSFSRARSWSAWINANPDGWRVWSAVDKLRRETKPHG